MNPARNTLLAMVLLCGVITGTNSRADEGPSRFPRIELATPVAFPQEKITLNKRGLSSYSITSSVTHPKGHAVDLLYDAGEGAQIRDPISGRIVWVAKSKLGNPGEIPSSGSTDPAAEDTSAPPPVSVPFTTSNSHAYVERVPLTIEAEILGLQKYPMPGQKGGFWSTEVKPIDLALAWGPFVKSGGITARMGYRSASFGFSDPLAKEFTGNFHMAVDDPEVRKKLLSLRVGEVVRLQGALIRLEHPRGKADPGETTITGAFCYTMLCRNVERVGNFGPH